MKTSKVNASSLLVSVIDAETDPFLFGRVPDPFIWGYWNGSEYREFRTTQDLCIFLRMRPGSELIYAHNGGRFDFHYLLPYVDDGEIMVINGRLARVGIGEHELRDSALILPMPLSAYKKDEIDYTKFEKDVRDKHMGEIRPYLKNDCIYLREMVMHFIDEFGPALTLAGAALKDLVSRCSLQKPKTSRRYHEALQPFYKGGRVEARTGEWDGPVRLYDINSAYPWAMAKCRHAWGSSFTIDKKPRKLARYRAEGFYKVSGPETWVFPRATDEGATYRDSEEIVEYCVTGHELNVALELGWTGRVVEAWMPEGTVSFAPFINFHYERKKRSAKDSPEYILSKLVMNSSYGKLGCNPDNWRRYFLTPDACGPDEDWYLSGEMGNRFLYERRLYEEEETWLDVATAASITGAVRAKLAKAMACVGRANVLYCDTDSLFLLNKRLDCGTALGEWSEEAVFKRVWIAGKKIYYGEGDTEKVRCKGARLTGQEIIELVKGGEVEYHRPSPTFSIGKPVHFITRRLKRRD